MLTKNDYFPFPPAKKDYGIGIVGCGDIVRSAHAPAYKSCGYRVVSCFDIAKANARAVAERFDGCVVADRLEDLLDDERVEIIDLAAHAAPRVGLIERIVAQGRKPRAILSQKPFAMNLPNALHLERLCREANLPLMVNQQMRWAPAPRALKVLIERGLLGHVYSVAHTKRSNQDHAGTWYAQLENFVIVDHGIHFIDLSRYFTGRTPVRVKAAWTRVPGQVAVSPLHYSIVCEYAPDAQVVSTLFFNDIVASPQTTARDEWIVDGTEGSAITTPSQITVVLKNEPRRQHVFHLEGAWYPDAFGGAMGELMQALTENREPQTSARDNLNTLRIAYAAVESCQTGQTVPIEVL